ncbi:MAG: hypothetical protein QW491_09435 [Thermoproteota archaeon]
MSLLLSIARRLTAFTVMAMASFLAGFTLHAMQDHPAVLSEARFLLSVIIILEAFLKAQEEINDADIP